MLFFFYNISMKVSLDTTQKEKEDQLKLHKKINDINLSYLVVIDIKYRFNIN